MSKELLCIEILGESAFHKFLVQSGWSGKDYIFVYNEPTNSHIRAYRRKEDYLAERVDIHKAGNVWPLLANLLPIEKIQPHALIGEPDAAPVRVVTPEPEVPPVETAGASTQLDAEPAVESNVDHELLPPAETQPTPVKRGPGRPPKISV